MPSSGDIDQSGALSSDTFGQKGSTLFEVLLCKRRTGFLRFLNSFPVSFVMT